MGVKLPLPAMHCGANHPKAYATDQQVLGRDESAATSESDRLD